MMMMMIKMMKSKEKRKESKLSGCMYSTDGRINGCVIMSW